MGLLLGDLLSWLLLRLSWLLLRHVVLRCELLRCRLLRCVLVWDLLLLRLDRLLDWLLLLDWPLGCVRLRGRCVCRAVLDGRPVSGVLLSRPLVW
ncbi:hypothetical protein EV650_4729 [Kribbella kalugense]|uniref:Uncharacterized protein n=1 Tax=Kribbella kalugense TaxID=2512221 RepID=A0A4R7ZNP7_9ACTN|nr:hypothetical protein EV650_4729 [Kribbella kalugense]